jgi:hypothetical protein
MTDLEQGIRDHLAELDRKIAELQHKTAERISQLEFDHAEHITEVRRKFHDNMVPLLRERDAIGKMLADSYALRASPPTITVRSHG